MTKIYAVFEVDEERLVDNDDETVAGRFEEECGWLDQSGAFVRNVMVSDEKDDWHRYLAYLIDWAMMRADLGTKNETPMNYHEFLHSGVTS